MRELSLFSGAGGGLLGSKLLGWKRIGYVEFNDYCQRVIKARIEDGILDKAPIFGDIRTFICEGYAASYTGLVDVLTAGFPCQPFSLAGKQEGADDPRNMWPETIECIRIIRPRFALLENVPGLLSHEYGRTIFRGLAESGYECRWRILSAAESGAPHKRDRLWIVAYNYSNRRRRQQEFSNGQSQTNVNNNRKKEPLANSNGERLEKRKTQKPETERAKNRARTFGGDWWAVEPDVGRVAHGVASRVDRLKALGNGQVPAVVKAAWQILTFQAYVTRSR